MVDKHEAHGVGASVVRGAKVRTHLQGVYTKE